MKFCFQLLTEPVSILDPTAVYPLFTSSTICSIAGIWFSGLCSEVAHIVLLPTGAFLSSVDIR